VPVIQRRVTRKRLVLRRGEPLHLDNGKEPLIHFGRGVTVNVRDSRQCSHPLPSGGREGRKYCTSRKRGEKKAPNCLLPIRRWIQSQSIRGEKNAFTHPILSRRRKSGRESLRGKHI